MMKTYYDNSGPMSTDIPEEFFVDKEVANARFDACIACPRLQDGMCPTCECVPTLKIKLKSSQCPDGLWE